MVITRAVLWVFAAFWIIGGVMNDIGAKSSIHQILAQIDYVVAAIFIIGAEICGAIYATRPAVPVPVPVPASKDDGPVADAEVVAVQTGTPKVFSSRPRVRR